MITIPFYELIDQDSEIWQLINKQRFPSLYPPNVLPDDIIENINGYFYDREIAYSAPEKFLRQWWRLVKERAYAWTKLLQTETVLRDDDMLFNYDLTEHSEDNRETSGKSESVNRPDIKDKITPDLLNTTQSDSTQNGSQSQSSKENNSQNASNNQTNTENGSHGTVEHDMDTPDGITSDIDNYLTRANRTTETDNVTNTQNGTSSQSGNRSSTQTGSNNQKINEKTINRQTGTTTSHHYGEENSETNSSGSDKNIHDLRRYGNIGTMTVASVLGGYREAQQFDVYSQVIFPECENLFLHFVDLDTIDIW